MTAKSAAKAASKTKPAPAPIAQVAAALTKATTPVVKKTNAERFPTAAKKEAEQKAKAAAAPKKAPAKTVRKASEPKERVPGKKETLAKQTVAFVARTIGKGKPFYALSANGRPGSGLNLVAHTHAALTVLGMLDPKMPAAPLTAVRTIMGPTAVAYHLKQNNFQAVDNNGIKLTPAGRSAFLARTVNNEIANAFVDMMIDGKLSPVLKVPSGEMFQAKV